MNNANKQSIINTKQYIISIDYQIDSVIALFLEVDEYNHTYIIKIYNYYPKRHGYKTDEDIYNDLVDMVKNYKNHEIIITIEPDAASMIECIKRHNEFKLSINKCNIS